MSSSTKTRFARVAGAPEGRVNLAEAALLIAADEYPALDTGPYLSRLDELADGIRAHLDDNPDPVDIVRAMNVHLFTEQGFSGNVDDYADPRNSFLNDVLDRKLGIPITLSLIYIEVGWRLGLPLQGVSFPGHFLVKLRHGGGAVVLDPFFGGVSLSVEDLQERLREVLGDELIEIDDLGRFLAGASKKEILVRMLRNLKIIYREREQHERILGVLDRILLIIPDDLDELRERAESYHRLECHRGALADYARYLALAPDAPDSEHVRERIIELHGHAVRLN